MRNTRYFVRARQLWIWYEASVSEHSKSNSVRGMPPAHGPRYTRSIWQKKRPDLTWRIGSCGSNDAKWSSSRN